MKHYLTHLKRVQRELERQRRRAQDERPRVQVIEVYCEGELVEVMPVGAPAELSQPMPSSSASSR